MAFISKVHFNHNVSLAWPLALNSILVQSMIVIDLMMVAPLGEIPINALGIATAIIGFLIGTQFALSNGTQMLIARKVGAGKSSQISQTLATGWLINVGFSIVTFFILLFGQSYIIHFLIDNAAVAIDVERYISISVWMLMTSAVTQVLIAYFNGCGRTKIPMYGFLLEIPFNITVSLLLIHGLFGLPALGVQGAALGSLVAVFIRMVFLIICLSKDREVNVAKGFKNVNRKGSKRQLEETLPIAANFLTLQSGMLVYQLLFAQLDVYSYAAIALVLPWMRMALQFANAWSQATAINLSQYRGRDEMNLIPEFLNHAVRITFIVSVLTSLILLAFSLLIPKLYPAMEKETLLALSIVAPIYILAPLVRSYNTVCGHSLRALGESMNVLKIHVTSQWFISLPLLALLIFLKAPLMVVFGVTLFEESLKTLFFQRKLKQKLHELRI